MAIASICAVVPLGSYVRNAEQKARKFLHPAADWIERLARAGYVAKGVVYGLVGLIALLAATGFGVRTAGSKGAIYALLDLPAGILLVLLIAAGLTAYALWCMVQAVSDADRSGRTPKALARRALYLLRGIVHLLVVAGVLAMLVGWRSGSSDEQKARDWTAQLMSLPAGLWLVGAVGVGVVIYGLYQVYRGWTRKVDKQIRVHQRPRLWTRILGSIGFVARGIVMGTIGVFLVLAALRSNPNEARGIGEALHALQEQPYGPWLLGAVALGLIGYGVYNLLRARYRRVNV